MPSQTQLATNTFTISAEGVNPHLINALLDIKLAAAQVHSYLEIDGKPLLSQKKSDAIGHAIHQLFDLEPDQFQALFPVNVFQTGSGTNTNMNVNEVVATLATQKAGEAVHPNNDVNLGQSSNDTFPSAIQLACVREIQHQVIPATKDLIKTITTKSKQLGKKVKTGRTHSMDAMPIFFADELKAWAASLQDNLATLEEVQKRLRQIPLGGTAVGSGINTHPLYAEQACEILSIAYKTTIKPAKNFSSRMGSQHVLLETSNALTLLATTLNKIASDLILLNSGPLCGFGDLQLPKHLEGSSIMPGKVNPVIPEAVCQVYARVMGNHSTVQIGAGNSRLQLNVYLPIMGNALLENTLLLSEAAAHLAPDIEGFTVNYRQVDANLSRNPILATGLNRQVGYDKGKQIVQTALKEDRPLLDVAEEMTDLSRGQLEKLLDPSRLAAGGL